MNVVILRGCSGSGKSTWTRDQISGEKRIFSADHFFQDADGKYNFDASKLGQAHAECLRNYITALVNYDRATLVIDNTNTRLIDVAKYADAALAFQRPLQIVTILCKPEVAYARNTHGVPLKTVKSQYDQLLRTVGKFPPYWPEIVVEI